MVDLFSLFFIVFFFVQEIGEALSDLKLLCAEIRKSDTFRKILGLLLSIGNFLNGVNVRDFFILLCFHTLCVFFLGWLATSIGVTDFISILTN